MNRFYTVILLGFVFISCQEESLSDCGKPGVASYEQESITVHAYDALDPESNETVISRYDLEIEILPLLDTTIIVPQEAYLVCGIYHPFEGSIIWSDSLIHMNVYAIDLLEEDTMNVNGNFVFWNRRNLAEVLEKNEFVWYGEFGFDIGLLYHDDIPSNVQFIVEMLSSNGKILTNTTRQLTLVP